MTDILKGAVGGAWAWLVSFVLPAALFLGALGFVAKLQSPDPRLVVEWMVLTSDSQLLIAGFAALTLGMVFLALNNVILRVLEGYIGIRQIKWLWDLKCRRQRTAKFELQNELDALHAATSPKGPSALEMGFVIEKLMHYPADDAQVGPTRFANAIRASETYGATSFGLDSQTLWQEILASAPEPARVEQAAARGNVDFLANLLFASACFAGISGCSFVAAPSVSWAMALLVGAALVPVWYQLAIQATYQWAGTIRAVVNLGRLELAKSLGLELPSERSDEVDMWQHLVWLVREGPVPGDDPLYRFRSRQPEK